MQVNVGLRSQVPMLTRISEYSLLNNEAISTVLATADWDEVADSGSGPKRFATELGYRNFPDLPEVRIVVSRWKLSSDAGNGGAGTVQNGWHYELFASTIPAVALSAPELVNVYYGRSGIENQFACENRELSMNRLYSEDGPGQTLAPGIAMFVWNMQNLMGQIIATREGQLPQPEDSLEEEPPQELEPSKSASPGNAEDHQSRAETEETMLLERLEIAGDAWPAAGFPVLWTPPRRLSPTRTAIRQPLLLNAELRKLMKRECLAAIIRVDIDLSQVTIVNLSPYIAYTPAIRQRRRKTWDERRRWNALPDLAVVSVRIDGSPNLARLLGKGEAPADNRKCP